MGTIPEINNIVTNRHDVARDWKVKTGGKVIGYLNIDLPEELIYAAGILPVRILGSHEPEVITDPHMWNMMHCVFERDCLAQGLQGRYDYLDGIIHSEGDPHEESCFLSWTRAKPMDYQYRLCVPGAYGLHHAQSFLRGEIAHFKQSLEEWTGEAISDHAIDRAIEVYNKSRRLMNQLSELRKSDTPPISGAEFMETALAGMLTDKENFNTLLEQFLIEIPKRKKEDNGGIRIMLSGGPNDYIDVIKSIEDMGARVVVDEHDTGGRYYTTDVIPEEDRLNALSARIINKPRSALKDMPERTRHQHLIDLAKEYRAQGVIFMYTVHDDAEQFDYPANKAAFESIDIPTLMLELDFTNPLEQFRTRVEAFLETIEPVGV
ncbi:2-hydroxyacyl-CoA dehydratase [Thermodesulfobacteriota bacterium]